MGELGVPLSVLLLGYTEREEAGGPKEKLELLLVQ